MTRYIRFTPSKAENVLDWPNMVDVQFQAKGADQWFVLKHRAGQEYNYSPHDAQNLYHQVKSVKGCAHSGGCFYLHQCDKPPTSCITCRLGEQLEGLGLPVRPDPVPPFVEARPGIWRCCLWIVAAIAIANVAARIVEGQRSPTLSGGDRQKQAPSRSHAR